VEKKTKAATTTETAKVETPKNKKETTKETKTKKAEKPTETVKTTEKKVAETKEAKQQKETQASEKGSTPAVKEKYQSQLDEDKVSGKVAQPAPKPQVRYSDEDLEIFRKRILEVKKEALEELEMLKERLEDLNAYDLAEEGSIYSMHMAEQGSEIFEKEKVYAQIQRINEYIKKLDEALKRIDDKTYGICRVCGILIAKERLLAVPITTLSASYKIHKKCPEDGIDRIEPLGK